VGGIPLNFCVKITIERTHDVIALMLGYYVTQKVQLWFMLANKIHDMRSHGGLICRGTSFTAMCERL
jgi:hypothetical protein